jgi:hypothetical protein
MRRPAKRWLQLFQCDATQAGYASFTPIALFDFREFAAEGGLMSYAASQT